jgi:hypothetical protein
MLSAPAPSNRTLHAGSRRNPGAFIFIHSLRHHGRHPRLLGGVAAVLARDSLRVGAWGRVPRAFLNDDGNASAFNPNREIVIRCVAAGVRIDVGSIAKESCSFGHWFCRRHPSLAVELGAPQKWDAEDEQERQDHTGHSH